MWRGDRTPRLLLADDRQPSTSYDVLREGGLMAEETKQAETTPEIDPKDELRSIVFLDRATWDRARLLVLATLDVSACGFEAMRDGEAIGSWTDEGKYGRLVMTLRERLGFSKVETARGDASLMTAFALERVGDTLDRIDSEVEMLGNIGSGVADVAQHVAYIGTRLDAVLGALPGKGN